MNIGPGDVLGPTPWARFALDYPDDARASSGPKIHYAPEFFVELTRINSAVNQAITSRESDGSVTEPWRIFPVKLDDPANLPEMVGDCHDYAATKRHLLIEAGYQPHNLLLAIVIAREMPQIWHCVLVARTDRGDFVLDSLVHGPPALWHVRNFEWLKVQSQENPNVWANL